jgi:hypothetical protein
MALYTLTTDHNGVSSCHGSCAAVWPPLDVAAGATPTTGPGVTGTVATSKQADGTFQVTYNGSPVYTFVGDTGPDQVTGNSVSDFFVVTVATTTTTTTTPTPTPGGPTPSPTGGSPAAAPAGAASTASSTGSSPAAGATTAGAGALAFTGVGPGVPLLTLLGVGLVLSGIVATVGTRRRRRVTAHHVER